MTCSACGEGWPVRRCPECGPKPQVQRDNYVVVTRAKPEALPPTKTQLRVVAAAHLVRLTPEGSGDPRAVDVIVSAPPPARHANLFAIMPDGPYPCGDESGFLLSDGSFAGRAEAMRVALASGQLDWPTRSGDLFSEDLW